MQKKGRICKRKKKFQCKSIATYIYYVESFLHTEITIFSQKVFNQKIKQWNIRYRTNILVKKNYYKTNT